MKAKILKDLRKRVRSYERKLKLNLSKESNLMIRGAISALQLLIDDIKNEEL